MVNFSFIFFVIYLSFLFISNRHTLLFFSYPGGFSKCGLAHRIRYFNLECNQWVSDAALLDEPAVNPFSTGAVFSNSIALKDHKTLIVTGGFNNIHAISTVLAFKLPSFIAGKNVLFSHCTTMYNSKGKQAKVCGASTILLFYQLPDKKSLVLKLFQLCSTRK